MPERPRGFDTRAVHAGELRPRVAGAVVTPIFQTANYEYLGDDPREVLAYARVSNTPNHAVLHAKLAALEGAEAALATASGMAAISTALLSVLRPGEHLLAQDCLYGTTQAFLTRELAALGVEASFVPGDEPEAWARALRPTTRAFYLESVSNPLMQVPELEAAVAFARAHGLVTLIDNTFPSPFNFRPAEHGLDLSLHSATKYLNGHSDLCAGAVIGRAELVSAARRKLDLLGGALDPHACFLLERGMKTLGLRMRRHNESALALARALEGHPKVARVHYPGLVSSPSHARAARLFDGFGGMLSVELAGGVAAARALLDRLELPAVATSLGGVEALVTLPARSSHAIVPPEERARLGIGDALVRVSTGIEDPEDLVADFVQALEGV